MKKIILLLTLVGILSLTSVVSAQFDSSHTWGSFGNGNGQFYGMSGVATDTSGNIYVAELDNRVQKFGVSGLYLTQFNNISARSIAIDSSGNIYATVNDSIKKFDSTGTLLNTWGSTGSGNGYFNFPTGIALDSLGNIYVSDTENNRIQKLDSSGNYITSWGTLGSGNRNFKSPAGITVSGNYVYVADMGNYRVQEFDLNGNYVSSLGSKGNNNTQFNSSIAVANDSSGNIYVADYYNGRVLEYDSNFNYLTQYTGLSYPTALVVANNNLYVLDSGNYQVYEYYNNTTNQSTPTITWSNPANITYGTALSITQLNAVASDPITGVDISDQGTFTYTPAAGTVLSAGARTLHADFTPNNISNYTTASKDVTINVSNVTPTINWSKPAAINYGTALSEAQLNAAASDPVTGNTVNGSFAYNHASGTILGAGNQSLQTIFTPTDTTNYTMATSSVSLTVNKATPLITWTNPTAINYGTALSETQLNASASVPGSPFVYTPASGTVLSIGTHILHADFTPNDTANYTNATADVTINVSVLPVANFTVNVTNGSVPLSVQFNDSSENATAWSWNFGDKQISTVQNPSHTYNTPGIYTISLNVSNANGYNISTKSNLITVNSTTPPVTNGLVVYYDGRLSGNSLLDLSGNGNTGYATNVTSGTFSATGADYINLNGINSKIDVSNNPQTNISSPISIEFIGSINAFSKYGALVSKYNNGVTGWYLSSSSASPYNHARFGAGTNGILKTYESDGSLVASQVCDIVVTYDNNVTHIYINGVDSGTRTWNSPIAGLTNNITIGYGSGLPYGNCSMYAFRLYNRSLSSDEVLQNYKSDLWRYKLTPKILWSNPADITYETALSSTQLNAIATDPVTGANISDKGVFTYRALGTLGTIGAGTILSAGSHTLHVDFAPTDTANYTNATANVTINVTEEPVLPAANFSYAMVNYPPLTIQFTDTSTNSSGANYEWNFGDGSSNVTIANPLHTFTSLGVYPVQETVSNDAVGSTTKTQNVDVQYPSSNLNAGELQLWTFDASKVSSVPNNIYTTTKNIPYTSNVTLTYNSALGSIDSGCWHNDNGETYITGAYPTVNQNLTVTMGVDSNSPWSYGYLHTSVADLGVRHASDGSYWIYSYWVNDTGSQLNSSYQIPATSVVNNRVTVSIHSYDLNRTNVITSGSTLYVTTPYTTMTTRNLPYTNVIQPLIYEAFYASGEGGWVNVHLYNITQSIPRNIITPYARNDIMAFGLDAPNSTNNQLGTDFLISRNQSATVFVSGGVDEEDIEYNEYLFNHGFEEGMHFYPGLASLSLEDSKALMDNEMDHVNSFFGAMPTSWSSHANDDNITHAIYMYQKYSALYRTGYQGMGFISNSINLQNNTWYWWNISSAHGAISPCFTHQTDIYPAPLFAIDPSFFNTFVTNLNSNGINLVGFTNWYCSSMAQNATINLLQYDVNHIMFHLSTSGGYPVNMNVQTVISPSYLYCDGVSIPFKQTYDGIQFVSAGNGTYILTNTPLATPSITWSNPSAITYGTALSSTQLNATASVPGTFAYNPTSGTVLSGGSQILKTTFKPSDTTTYTTATSNVSLTVNKATPLITWSNPANITYGTSLSETQLNASASVHGTTFVYTPASGTVLSIGTHTLHADFTPNDTANYTNATADVTINVSEKPVLPVANFTVNVTNGSFPLSIQFNDSSENATSWSWNFGDGQISTVQNPSHTYNTPGVYTVSLNASNANSYNISTKSNLIAVNSTPPPVTNGLVVYYDGRLSENSLVDLSGNNNIGYATNVTSGTNQVTRVNHINLNGVNGKIDVSNNAQTNISSPISIEFIGSINEFKKYGALVSKYNNGVTGWYLSSSSADPYNQIRVGIGLQSSGLNVYNSDVSLVAGKVYDIVFTYDSNTTHLYVNGMDSGSKTRNSPIAGLANNITIGYGSGLPYGNCSMYAFRLYNRSLSSDEVLQNYKSDLWRYNINPKIFWSKPADITYGTALSSTQLNAAASDPVTGNTIAGSFVYTPASGTILSAGTQTLQVTFTPTDTVNYTTATSSLSLTVNKATPLITWSNPANITYGTSLSETQLNASASVPGNFTYNQTAGTVLSIGPHTLHVDFTPNDTENYTNATANVIINVSEKPVLPVANFTVNVTNGRPPLSVKFNDTSTGSPASWSWDFGDGQTSTVQNLSHTYNTPGIYTVSLNASNANGYNISTKPNLITVIIPQPRPGLVVYYDGRLSGNSLLDLSGNNNIGYATNVTSGTNQVTGANYINLNGVNSKIDVSNNPQTNISSPVSIEFIGSINEFKKYGALVSKYNGGVTGWYLSSSSSSPYNQVRLAIGVQNGGLKVYNSDASLVAGQVYDIIATYDNNTASIYVNGVNSGTRTFNSPIAGLANNITIGYGSGLPYGNCSMYAFRLYNRSLSSDEVLQNYKSDLWRYKLTPKIFWSNSADITYGTALSSTQLNAAASDPVTGNTIAGSFVYTPASGTILSAGTQTLQVTFTPTDTVNYTTATNSVSLTVNKATPLITWTNPSAIGYGTALSGAQLDASASVPGSFVYTPISGTVLSQGTHTLHVDFTPTDTADYTTVSKDVTINVNKMAPTVIWSNPAAINYGTAVSETQLNAAASVPGSFAYNPVSGTILGAGTQTLQTTFTPTDNTNYTTATSSVSLTVNKATPLITWSSPADITYGTSLSETQLNASASVPGSFVYTPASGTVLSEGTHTLHVDFTPSDATNFTTASSNVSINVVNNDPVESSSGNREYNPTKQIILEPNNTQPLNSSEDTGNDIEYESGNKTINEDNGNKTELESGNKTIKGLQTEQKGSHSIPGFEIYYGVVCLLGLFLYKRK